MLKIENLLAENELCWPANEFIKNLWLIKTTILEKEKTLFKTRDLAKLMVESTNPKKQKEGKQRLKEPAQSLQIMELKHDDWIESNVAPVESRKDRTREMGKRKE